MTPKKRKIVSKSLIDLFNARKQEYQAITNEREEVIKQYDTGDDLVQREYHKDIAETMNFALNEVELLDNYTITKTSYYYKLLEFANINIGTKIWDGVALQRYDNPLMWSLLPDYTTSGTVRSPDVINSVPDMYRNLSFNSAETGPGKDEPFQTTINSTGMCDYDTTETTNLRNFKRIFDAFTNLRSAFINNGSFRASGNNFWSDDWPPHDMYSWSGDYYIPSFTPSTYDKISGGFSYTNGMNPYNANIADLMPNNTYVVCATQDLSTLKICKLYDVSEANTTTIGHESGVDVYTFSMKARVLSETLNSPLYINIQVGADNAYRVFNELKNIYLLHLNAMKAFIATKTENYSSVNDLTSAINSFIAAINSIGSVNTVSKVDSFYSTASSFNTYVSSRISTLTGIINSEDNRDDIRELTSLRASKSNGTLFDVFRKIEGMDGQIARYKKGASRISFLKKKLITAEIIEQPNNSYQITLERQLDENYSSGESINVGDTIYIIDEVRPEVAAKVIKIRYGTIDDVDGDNMNSSDPTSSVKKKNVKFIETSRIISKDFDRSEVLRIVKEL